MRIAIDCRAFQYLSRYLGIGTYSSNLIQALAQVNVDHELIPFAHVAKAGVDGVDSPFESLAGHHQGFRIDGKRSFLHQLTTHRVDICHLLEFTPPFATADRTVATVYDLIPLVFPKVYLPWWRIRSGWNLRAYYRFLKQVPQILAISHHTKAALVRLLKIPPRRIRVIYPGIHPLFRPLTDLRQIQTVLTRYGIVLPYLLYVGSCDYRKNIPGLMRAFARFRAGVFREFHLVLVGKLTEIHRKALLKYGSALGLDLCLHLVGYVPLEDLVALYNAATMLVYPSFYEGFGFPPLEAMACGVPVITSRNSSLSEVTDGCALYVNPSHDEGLAEAMRQLVLDRGLKETLLRRGWAHVQRFRWEQTAQETLLVYEEFGGV